MVERQPSVDLWQRTYLFGVATAIYRVQTKRGAVFMSVMRSNYCNEDRAVVIIDSGRFLRAWRAAAGPVWLGGRSCSG